VKTLSRYWGLYGGWKALFRSPYLYLGLVITVLSAPFWLKDGEDGPPWAQTAVEIIPSLLGFSMGGMTIMLAFSNAAIFTTLTQKGKHDSLFLKVTANFFHFILVQTLAVVLALIGKAYGGAFIGFLGFWALTYALLVALATAGQLLNTAEGFNKMGGLMAKPHEQNKSQIAAQPSSTDGRPSE